MIQLTQGKSTLVDEDDYERFKDLKFYAVNYKGWWYAKTTTPHRYLHRLILNVKNNEYVDHINGDGLDNRRCNLRTATNSQNQMNSKKPSGGTSRYKGVNWNKEDNCWYSRITANKKSIFLGCYFSEIDSAKIYDKMATELFGEYAKLNFPEEVS